MPCRLQDLSSLTRNWIQALAVKVPSPDHWTTREFPIHFLKFQFCGLKTPYNLSLVVAQSLLFGVSVFLPVKRYVICAFMYIHIYIYTHTHTHTYIYTYIHIYKIWLCHEAYRILVPPPGIKPGPWHWKRRVLTPAPPGNSHILYILSILLLYILYYIICFIFLLLYFIYTC